MRHLLPLFFIMSFTGCAVKQSSAQETYGAQIGIVNHTGKFIYEATVNGRGGALMERWGAGTAGLCCVDLPLARRAGLQVRLEWDTPEGDKHEYHEKMVNLEIYEEGASLYLHFFPDGSARAIVTGYSPASPHHPIPHRGKPK